jgi:hypothetical protein
MFTWACDSKSPSTNAVSSDTHDPAWSKHRRLHAVGTVDVVVTNAGRQCGRLDARYRQGTRVVRVRRAGARCAARSRIAYGQAASDERLSEGRHS